MRIKLKLLLQSNQNTSKTGKKAIYVNRTFTTGIDGMSKEESSSILNFLFNHCEHVNYQITDGL